MTKWTALIFLGFKLLAYLIAPTVAISILSINTVTSCLVIDVALESLLETINA